MDRVQDSENLRRHATIYKNEAARASALSMVAFEGPLQPAYMCFSLEVAVRTEAYRNLRQTRQRGLRMCHRREART